MKNREISHTNDFNDTRRLWSDSDMLRRLINCRIIIIIIIIIFKPS